jgi:hypothetical protein
LNLIEIFSKYNKIRGVVEEKYIKKFVTSDNGYKDAWKKRWQCIKRSQNGPSLNLTEIKRFNLTHSVDLIYSEGSQYNCDPEIPVKAIAWLFGLYLADGTIDESRIIYYLDEYSQELFLEYTEKLKRAWRKHHYHNIRRTKGSQHGIWRGQAA